MLNVEFLGEQARSKMAVDIMEERNSSLQARTEEAILKAGETRDEESLKAARPGGNSSESPRCRGDEEQLQMKQCNFNHESSVVKEHASRQEQHLLARNRNDTNQQHAAKEERLMQKLIRQEQEVRGLQQVEQKSWRLFKTLRTVGLAPTRDYAYVANLQAREELQQVTAFLHETREERPHQQALMFALQQHIKHLTDKTVHKEEETATQTQAICRQWYQDEIAQRDRELLVR
eukprot:4312199-Prorocentrum_lima.AAC.1